MEASPKDSKMEKETEYLLLLNLLSQVIEENKGSPAGQDGRFLEAEGLALKLFYHSASAFCLSRGTTIKDFPSVPIGFFDPASIHVLTRAILETFLTFHYVFVAPKTDQIRNFRYWAWQLGGFYQRQKFPVQLPESKQKQKTEKPIIEELRTKLTCNPIFQSLKERQQNKILTGRWRQKSWREIALDAEFNELHASTVYSYLSEYAHSGSLSALQIRQVKTKDIQRSLFAGSMNVIMIAIANMIFSYCEIFPKGKKALKTNPQATNLAQIWVNIGQEANIVDK